MLKTGLAFAGLLAFGGAWPVQAGDLPQPVSDHWVTGIPIPAGFAVTTPSLEPSLTSPDPAGSWWQVFGDPALDALIARMHAGNTHLQQAAARLAAANARARVGTASQAPFVGITATASHEGGPLINKAGDNGSLFTAGLAVSWEADLLGRMAGTRAAERLDANAAAATFADTRLLMEAATVRTYFQAIYLQQAASMAAREAALWQERERIAAARMQNGLSDPLDLGALRQRAFVSAASAAELARTTAETLDALAFLLGDTTPPALVAHSLPAAPAIPAGLPSDVLARRPDIAAALAHVQAAGKRLDAARHNWLPSFGLTAAGGVASPTVGDLLASSARSFGLDLLFALPLFDGGRREAQMAGNKAEADLATAEYHETLLNSLREVNNALAGLEVSKVQVDLAGKGFAISNTALTIVAQRASRGTASQSQLIEAQLLQLHAGNQVLRMQYLQLADVIDFVKAIGGGWAAR